MIYTKNCIKLNKTKKEEIPAKIKELNLKQPSKLVNNNKNAENSSSDKASRNEHTAEKETEKERHGSKSSTNKKQVNYVVLSKKRGLNSENGRESENGSNVENEQQRLKSRRAEDATDTLENVNIIDVISSEYFKEDEGGEGTSASKKTPSRTPEKISCNGVEMTREKATTSPGRADSSYVYDIYYARFNPTVHSHLDLLYPSNIEVKSYGLYGESELIDETTSSDEKEGST